MLVRREPKLSGGGLSDGLRLVLPERNKRYDLRDKTAGVATATWTEREIGEIFARLRFGKRLGEVDYPDNNFFNAFNYPFQNALRFVDGVWTASLLARPGAGINGQNGQFLFAHGSLVAKMSRRTDNQGTKIWKRKINR